MKVARNFARKLGVHWRMFADNPEKLLEEIKECRRQETAWKKDSSSVDARRILVGYGGRIVADIDEAAAADGEVRFGLTPGRRHDAARRSRNPKRAESAAAGGRISTRAVPR